MPGVRYDHQSIVRNGNHFIRLGPEIKNPQWDEHLEELFSFTTYFKENI